MPTGARSSRDRARLSFRAANARGGGERARLEKGKKKSYFAIFISPRLLSLDLVVIRPSVRSLFPNRSDEPFRRSAATVYDVNSPIYHRRRTESACACARATREENSPNTNPVHPRRHRKPPCAPRSFSRRKDASENLPVLATPRTRLGLGRSSSRYQHTSQQLPHLSLRPKPGAGLRHT